MDNQELYAKAAAKWGTPAQILIAIEELGELSAALSRFLNERGCMKERRAQVIEEIADVTVMIGQMTMVFGELEVNENVRYAHADLRGLLSEEGEDGKEES